MIKIVLISMIKIAFLSMITLVLIVGFAILIYLVYNVIKLYTFRIRKDKDSQTSNIN